MKLSPSASALGLYKYDIDPPRRDLFRQFYETVIHVFKSFGAIPTFVGAEGDGYSGKFAKFGGRAHEQLTKTGFADITVLSIAANPHGSDEPSYDSFATASLSYAEADRELIACIVINEALVALHSPQYDGVMRTCVDLCDWDFGYGFSSAVNKQPDFYILGLDNGKLPKDEYKDLCVWYATSGDLRKMRLRDVYPYNILNGTQLDAIVNGNMTLRQFALCQPNCSLTRLTEYGLHLWKVPVSDIPRLKNALLGTSAMLS